MLDEHPRPSPPPSARERFAERKPLLGGNATAIDFDDPERAVIEAAADELIPATGPFPAPSAIGVVDFIARYVTPEDTEAVRFPFVREETFKTMLEGLARDGLLEAGADGRVQKLRELERSDPEGFNQFYELVIYAYYARREVTDAMRATLPAAADLRHTPQPYGYLDSIEPWDTALLQEVRGSFIPTEDVRPVGERPSTNGNSEIRGRH